MADARVEYLNQKVAEINKIAREIKIWKERIENASKMKSAEKYNLTAYLAATEEHCQRCVGGVNVPKDNAHYFLDSYVKYAEEKIERLENELNELLK